MTYCKSSSARIDSISSTSVRMWTFRFCIRRRPPHVAQLACQAQQATFRCISAAPHFRGAPSSVLQAAASRPWRRSSSHRSDIAAFGAALLALAVEMQAPARLSAIAIKDKTLVVMVNGVSMHDGVGDNTIGGILGKI